MNMDVIFRGPWAAIGNLMGGRDFFEGIAEEDRTGVIIGLIIYALLLVWVFDHLT